MEMATVQLGGHPVYIQKEEVGLGTRESAEDVARTLACYHSIIAARVADHELLERMEAGVETAVLKMLSGSDHPPQAHGELLMGRAHGRRVRGVKVVRSVEAGVGETGGSRGRCRWVR